MRERWRGHVGFLDMEWDFRERESERDFFIRVGDKRKRERKRLGKWRRTPAELVYLLFGIRHFRLWFFIFILLGFLGLFAGSFGDPLLDEWLGWGGGARWKLIRAGVDWRVIVSYKMDGWDWDSGGPWKEYVKFLWLRSRE